MLFLVLALSLSGGVPDRPSIDITAARPQQGEVQQADGVVGIPPRNTSPVAEGSVGIPPRSSSLVAEGSVGIPPRSTVGLATSAV